MRNEPMARLGFRYEPHVADRIFREIFASIPSISVFYGRYVIRTLKVGNRVTGVVTRNLSGADEIAFEAPVTIDATHEGDLLPLSGAKFRLGREARTPEEPHAGEIFMTHDGELLGSGAGDSKLQAYAMLITIKDYGAEADKTITKPPGYDPRNYAPEPKLETWWYTGGVLPNLKYEVNECFDGTDAADFHQKYIDGGREERRRVWEKYRDYSLGYLYFRQTVMGEKNMGLAEDEYPENGHFPYKLYVREGRRLEGVYMYNERDALRVPGYPRPPLQKNSIAVGDWQIDSHAVDRSTEGYIYLGVSDPYHVSAPIQAPYRIMVPKEVDGLLVPMAVSATHIGFEVLRLEPIRMAMGQAAGSAAALCVKRKVEPRAVPVSQLQEMLMEQGQALYYYKDVIPSTEHFRAIQRLSLAGIAHGDSRFTFRPDQLASRADAAKLLFHGFGLKVKMDYSDLWTIMDWDKRPPVQRRGRQNCTPQHWATYYLLTLFNLGAFSEDELRRMDPDSPIGRGELGRWAAAAKGKAELGSGDTLTRAELCDYVDRLRSNRA